jgi:TatD DNase family protein
LTVELIDSHAHLDFDRFKRDREAVISRARDAGVTAIINPGCDLETSRNAVRLAERYDIVYAAVGIHPNSTAEASEDHVRNIEELAGHDKVIAIGEIGLDYYRDRSPKDVQARLFREQLDMAASVDLPVILHFREVEEDGIRTAGVERLRAVRGVFHCFGGSAAFARQVMNMGYFIGFDGPLTYPRSDRVTVAAAVSPNKCLIETDAPFLTPQRKRGKRNEPAYVKDVAAKLAEAKGMQLDEIAGITSDNARALFGF